MATSLNCKFEGSLISIEQALIIKKTKKSSKFYCIECDQEVRPHSGGGHTNAHFEHKSRNPKCSLSHNGDSYKYSSNENFSKDSNLEKIYQLIGQRSDVLINDSKSWLKQLGSAKNYVTTPDLNQWTFGKSVNIENGYFNDGGVAKQWLYSQGFVNILDTEDQELKQFVITKFKEWASAIKLVDITQKFENDQTKDNRFELLVHQSVIENIQKSNLLNDSNDDIDDGEGLKGKEAYYLRKHRINQEEFRKRLIKYWKKCCVTGIDDPNFLIASHIKPWSECNDEEKLAVENGLLLAAPIDFLFDNYYLTFEDDGTATISSLAQKVYRHFTSIENIRIDRPLNSKQQEFMKYHRENFHKRNSN